MHTQCTRYLLLTLDKVTLVRPYDHTNCPLLTVFIQFYGSQDSQPTTIPIKKKLISALGNVKAQNKKKCYGKTRMTYLCVFQKVWEDRTSSNHDVKKLYIFMKTSRNLHRLRNWYGLIQVDSGVFWLTLVDSGRYGLIQVETGWYGLIWVDMSWYVLIWADSGWFWLIRVDMGWFGLIWADKSR